MATKRKDSHSNRSTGEKASHRIPGELTYEGLVLQKPAFNPAVLVRMPNVRMDPTDVLLASYPKAGLRYDDSLFAMTLNLAILSVIK